ncbi:TetR family transcriptional regulator C-terminal domain-containing protein [Paenibacillus sp. sptzw28]|uniref:TetR/AcrR family transcriptional regulator n=1 Tax=Paenibacillus sp. sptzw28 TaxID=715179 RepID=UPI001C6EF080|nr:TetR family transcriptional regulator C-terminal domain-containing protein [Paenibacillus sp. sptzw28]QYR23930.1 TetR family transcriptional regulator C-terminal domain-containing protein [Paenibacillus sp. sptzw28]
MPKIVNHQERKEKIAEAAWQVIRREGLDGITVRRVADELGISLGSLRYYFDSQNELIAYSMRLISQRANERIQKLPFKGEPRHDIELIIAEITPLDEERTLESEVWLAFAGKAVSDPDIRALSREVHDELHAGFRRMIDHLIARSVTKEGINAEFETKRLHALVDGLVVHHTTFPELFVREELMAVVSYHLDDILR